MFKMLTVLVSTIAQVFLLKNVRRFCTCKTYSHFFSKNISVYAIFFNESFNDSLINDIVSFKLPSFWFKQYFIHLISHKYIA